MLAKFVPFIKDAIMSFYHSSPTYTTETIQSVKDMLGHLSNRSDVVDALDGTYGILEKLKTSNAPKQLIEFAQQQYQCLSSILNHIQ